jgi:hypothetical protein
MKQFLRQNATILTVDCEPAPSLLGARLPLDATPHIYPI